MKNNHRHSTVSILLTAIVASTFVCHGVSFAQTKGGYIGEKTAFIISKIDAAVTKEFQAAWHVSHNGSDGFEGLVLVYSAPDGSISARSQGKSGVQKRFTFGWTATIIAVVHTHPNGDDPRPTGKDLLLADRFRVPVFTLTQRGMFVYDPENRKISIVQDGLDWLEASKWSHDRQAVSGR